MVTKRRELFGDWQLLQVSWKLKGFISFLLVFGIILQCKPTASSDIESLVTVSRTLANNRVITAFDSLLSDEIVSSLRTYANYYARWEFKGQELAEHCHSHNRGAVGTSECQDSTKIKTTDIPWTGKLDPRWFSQSNTWQRLKEALAYATNGSTNTFPYSVQSEILQRGDNVAPRVVSSSPYSKEYVFRIFLVPDWRMDDYGDMSFYAPSPQNRTEGSQYDILLTVRPNPGRVLLWEASVPTLYRPPSMGYIQKLLSISVHVTPSKERYEKACQEWKEQNSVNNDKALQLFPQLGTPIETIDLESHLVREFKDREGRKISVYDNLFESDHLEALRSYVVEHPALVTLPYDLESYELSDNVAWYKEFVALDFEKSSAWEVFSQVANRAGGWKLTRHPYDVSLNIVRSADHTRVHEDCEEWEEEYTMVLYLNRDLGPGDYGETIFYDATPLDSFSRKLYEGISAYDYDAIGAVNPKYGRLVIFNGQIPHSARPPSTGYTNARYTFTVKVTVDRKRAIAKKLRELMEESVMKSQEQLVEEIKESEEQNVALQRPEEWLEKQLRSHLANQRERSEERRQKLLEVI